MNSPISTASPCVVKKAVELKVLILPSNIASMPAITLERLNAAGIEARALFLDTNKFQDYKNSKTYALKGLKYGFVQKIYNFSRFYAAVLKGILWADVIHWCGTFSIPLLRITLPLIRLARKPCLVEWVGSDIRIPEVEFADNPYYKKVFFNGYEYAYESLAHSRKIQQLYKKAGFLPLVFPGMEQYILPDIFPTYLNYIQRIDLNKYEALYPSPENKRPVLVHAPTAPVCKGTVYIEEAVSRLKEKYDFEFILVKDMARAEALELIGKADIFIDQLVLGSYGMATMEAFAMGKPVVCYMKPSVLSCFPGTSPVVNANPETIYETLEYLLTNPSLRYKIGVESRSYAEKFHNIDAVLDRLITIYSNVITDKRRN